LSDEPGGTASYEIDLPAGGRSYVIGNVIEKGPTAENFTLLGISRKEQILYIRICIMHLFIVNNTFVNNSSVESIFLGIEGQITATSIIQNNIFSGPGAAIHGGTLPPEDANLSLIPRFQYAHPACGEERMSNGKLDVGAYGFDGERANKFGPERCQISSSIS
jgi:hypothetical protein